jgi:hypothetical protein
MLEIVIEPRRKSLGGFEVGHVLPFAKRRMVGPFVATPLRKGGRP